MLISQRMKLKREDPRYSREYLAKLKPSQLKRIIEKRSVSELELIERDWLFLAREEQLPPEEWGTNGNFIWAVRSGRGWGKTRTASETFIHAVRYARYEYPNLVGATADEVRDVMISGESGILACAPKDFFPEFIPSLKKLIWPNGVVSHIYYGSEPDKARGPQSDFLWCDELSKWQRPEETFDNLLMGLRLGENPLCVVTSTSQTNYVFDGLREAYRQTRKSV
jgi:phage terminase large subunit-like protein